VLGKMSSDNFCLKWNDHHTTFFSSAEQLCHNSLLTDVVLSAGGTLFKAHKLVLSVCSKFFQEIFSQPPPVSQAHNTVIYLKDVDSTHLQLLLSYMYRGEVDVADNQLGEFLKTASGLQIKGLSESDGQEVKSRPPDRVPSAPKSSKTFTSPAPPPPAIIEEEEEEIIEEPVNKRIKEESISYRGDTEPSTTWPTKERKEYNMMVEQQQVDMVGEYTGYEGEITGYDEGAHGGYEQEVGGWKISHPGDMMERLNKAYQCEMCSMSFSQKWLLKRHWKTHTGDKPYKCTICLRTFSLRDSCTRHLRTVHKEMISASPLLGEDVTNFIEIEDKPLGNRPASHLLSMDQDSHHSSSVTI